MSKHLNSNVPTCKGIVLDSGDGEFIVKGYVKSLQTDPTVLFWAANPATYCQSFSGAGMPFPNPEIAYDNTPNRGAVKAHGNQFKFKVRFPNAYYTNLGSTYVEPCVHIKVCGDNDPTNDKIHTVKLGHGIPFRSTTNTPYPKVTNSRTSPLFYSGRDNLPMRTQEQILRDSSFPKINNTPKNFWGKTPPHE